MVLRSPSEQDNFFQILGVPESLTLDETLLRERFYALSHSHHPDKFHHAPAEAMKATRLSSVINRAYQTLRDPEKRALYLLELHGIPEKGGAAVPLDLAETYFELQDLEAPEALTAFKAGLVKQLGEMGKEFHTLSREWDKSHDRAVLIRLREHLTKQRFLRSMIADLEKKLS